MLYKLEMCGPAYPDWYRCPDYKTVPTNNGLHWFGEETTNCNRCRQVNYDRKRLGIPNCAQNSLDGIYCNCGTSIKYCVLHADPGTFLSYRENPVPRAIVEHSIKTVFSDLDKILNNEPVKYIVPEKTCKTPDSLYTFHYYDSHLGQPGSKITLKVDTPIRLGLTEEEANKLEDSLHDAVESILAPYFK